MRQPNWPHRVALASAAVMVAAVTLPVFAIISTLALHQGDGEAATVYLGLGSLLMVGTLLLQGHALRGLSKELITALQSQHAALVAVKPVIEELIRENAALHTASFDLMSVLRGVPK